MNIIGRLDFFHVHIYILDSDGMKRTQAVQIRWGREVAIGGQQSLEPEVRRPENVGNQIIYSRVSVDGITEERVFVFKYPCLRLAPSIFS